MESTDARPRWLRQGDDLFAQGEGRGSGAEERGDAVELERVHLLERADQQAASEPRHDRLERKQRPDRRDVVGDGQALPAEHHLGRAGAQQRRTLVLFLLGGRTGKRQ